MIKSKIKSNRGYIFTYEAIAVAFIFMSIFYIGYMAYSHNFLTALEEKKDTENFHKALYLKNYYLKKYSYPGNYSDEFMDFTNSFNFDTNTFDLFHNFSEDKNHFAFIIHSNVYDKWLENTSIKNEMPLVGVNFSNGENFTIYSNVNNMEVNATSSFESDFVVFEESAYVPKITYHNNNEDSPEIYGCNGDVIYFLIEGTNINSASANIFVNISNTFANWEDWEYIAPILVRNRQNNDLTGYSVKIIFDSQAYISRNEMNENCSDVRFIDESGNELPYWIEPNTINTAHTVAWVKMNLDENEVKRIYMLYGNPNPNADSYSNNGDKTFVFFDNFSSKNLDKWDNISINTSKNPFVDSIYPNNNIEYTYLCLDYNNYTLPNKNDTHISKNEYGPGNEYEPGHAVRFHVNFSKKYEEWAGFYKVENGNDYNRQVISNYHWGGEYLRFESSKDNYNNIEYRILPDYYYNDWHTYEIQRNGSSSVNLLIDDDFYRSISKYLYSGNLSVAFYARQYDTSQGGYTALNERNGHIDIDWVFVRKYKEPEPEVTWESSDVIFTVNGNIYKKPLRSALIPIDITPNLKNNEVNEIRILSSAYPVRFSFTIENNADFSYIVFSPRNITVMVKP